MKKLLTLFAFLMCVLGAKAEWTPVYSMDYSLYSGFPFYVMGYVPEWNDGIMTDFGAQYGYKTDAELEDASFIEVVGTVTTHGGVVYNKILLENPGWHQYFILDGIPTKIDGRYKVVAKVKASVACSINVNMGWGWGEGQQLSGTVAIPQSDEFVEVEWEYTGIGGSSCNLVAQPGGCTETIEWQSVTVYEYVKAYSHHEEWLEDIENGDAEISWERLGLADVKYNDSDNNFKVCAWSKEKGRNMNENDGWDPFPADIEVDPKDENNHVFVCHGQPATTEGDASSWDNQFWIQSKHAWKAGLTMKIKFRYMANADVSSTDTQIHKQNPGDYLIWHAIGNIHFTEEWQTFDKDMTIADDMAGGWSIAFNLNSVVKDAVTFYFDDLSWQYLRLEEGYFLSGINQNVTRDYDDLDNAIQFETMDDRNYEATIGMFGDSSTYVDQLMISTTRGEDSAFKGATLYVSDKIHNDPDEWLDYTPAANKRLDVPGLGVWKVYIDTKYEAMAFEMLEGTLYQDVEPVEVVTNPTSIIVHGQEREYTEAEAEAAGIEKPENPGQPWDNQFFIKANRPLKAGEVTKLVFVYRGSVDDARVTTQCHGENPGAYMHWGAIGNINFTTDWQYYETEFTVPEAADGMQILCFNMAEIKEACDYQITGLQWFLYDYSLGMDMTYENLIDGQGTQNFYVKEGAGTSPYIYEGGQVVSTVWTITGSKEVFGSYWDPSDTKNDMRKIEEGVFMLEKKNVSLKAGEIYEFKVVGNHSWDINYGVDGMADGPNVEFTVDQDGIYNLYFYFYEKWNNQLGYHTEFVKGEDHGDLAEVYSIDYSTYRGFPFYVMGYVPEFDYGYMTDYGAMYSYKTEAELTGDEYLVGAVTTASGAEYYKIVLDNPSWHQYFIADGIPTELDGKYVVKAFVKSSEATTINVNMGWGWGEGQVLGASVSIPDEWTEVEWEYNEIGGTSCNLVAQPGTFTGTIDWQWLKVYKVQKGEVHPVEWIEYLANGDAETSWEDMGLANVSFDDMENNYKICAWSKEKGINEWNPFPTNIEVDPTNKDNHVFVVHAAVADTEGDASAWDNQFWIQSPKEWKTGDQVKVHFRYMCDYPGSVTTNTQFHKQSPGDYLIWHAIGDVTFTDQWQDFDATMTITDDMAGGWSVAFNLNSSVKDAVDFYFDDLSWQAMKLDEGFFVAGANTRTGYPEYDFYNATEFDYVEDWDCYTAIIGEFGEQDSWVNQLMISTVRGDDQAFRGHTIRLYDNVSGDPDQWYDYSEVSNAKISLPAEGVWQVYIDPQTKEISFVMLEGIYIEPLEIIPNPTVVMVPAKEREYTEAEAEELGIEKPENPGQPWDNQFFIVANRPLKAGESTLLSFRFKSSIPSWVGTLCHKDAFEYLHWAAIGDVYFEEYWQEMTWIYTVPEEADGMQSIAFNMAEIKEACNYEITDVIWMTEDLTETLIDTEGSKNFWVKVGAGNNPYQYDGVLMGDVDSNGQINVTDAVLIIDEILDKNPWNFNATAADVNFDSYINVTDVVLVIDHILGKTNLNPNRAAAVDGEVGTISLSTDMTTVSLTNPSAYTAFQMDVTLPMGVSLENAQLTERAAGSHSVVIRKLDNGSYRIIGVSMQNEAFEGTVGELLKLQLSGNAQGAVAINNVLFVTPQGVQHELAGVNAFGDVTGISDALRLNDNGQLINDNVFDLQGRKVNNAQLKKGLYILDGKKQIVK